MPQATDPIVLLRPLLREAEVVGNIATHLVHQIR